MNKYKYNGKEWQDELGLNMYAMDMRQYDPAIARWVVQDPIVHHSQSPYNGYDGNPVFFADPSGGRAEAGQTAPIYYDWDKGGWRNQEGGMVSSEITGVYQSNNHSEMDIDLGVNADGNVFNEVSVHVYDQEDPPSATASFFKWFNGLFNWSSNKISEDEQEERDHDRKGFISSLQVACEVGKLELQAMVTIFSVPLSGPIAGVEGGAALNVVKESSTKYTIISETGSASQFYKTLNPLWNGKFGYTKGAFSTTSFTAENGAKVIFNTTSSSTGMPTVKVISDGFQLLFRFGKL